MTEYRTNGLALSDAAGAFNSDGGFQANLLCQISSKSV